MLTQGQGICGFTECGLDDLFVLCDSYFALHFADPVCCPDPCIEDGHRYLGTKVPSACAAFKKPLQLRAGRAQAAN